MDFGREDPGDAGDVNSASVLDGEKEDCETSNLNDVQLQRRKHQENQQNKPKNLRTWISWKAGTKNFQMPVLVSTFCNSLRIVHSKTSSQLLSFLIGFLCSR